MLEILPEPIIVYSDENSKVLYENQEFKKLRGDENLLNTWTKKQYKICLYSKNSPEVEN